MKRLALAIAVCGVSVSAFAQQSSTTTQQTRPTAQTKQAAGEKQATGEKEACGKMIAESAKYPEQLKTTVDAAAESYEAHAKWVGTKTKEAKAEHDALIKLSGELRALGKQADRVATSMKSDRSLTPATHDLKNVPKDVISSMEKLRDEQQKFAQVLLDGSKEIDQQINQMRGVGGAGKEGTESEEKGESQQQEQQEHEKSSGSMEKRH